jgi:hypothetical protein
VFTVPLTEAVLVPSTLSTTVAPSSVYVPPTRRVTVVDPLTVMTGAVVSGVASTFTVRVTGVPTFPDESVAE